MKRCRIGNIEIDTQSKILRLDTPVSQMRQSEVRLLSLLDLLQEKANFAVNEYEENKIYNEQDKIFCLCQVVENLGGTVQYLKNALFVYNEAVESGVFDKKYNNLAQRNENVNTITLNIINDSINYNVSLNFAVSPDRSKWWKENIIDLNYYTDINTGEKLEYMPENAASIGASEYDFLGQFKESASAWCYTVVDRSFLAGSNKAILKREKQIESRNTLAGAGIQLDKQTQNNLIAAGILAQTNGGNEKDLINGLKAAGKQKTPFVGLTPELIGTIITAAVSILTAIIGVVLNKRKNELKQNAETTLKNTPTPSVNDWLDFDGDGTNDTNKILLFGVAALFAYYFI